MVRRLLAATKFALPALPSRYVARPRLLRALDDAAPLSLTVVVGLPGAGKSVLLRAWLHERPALASIWLSCDARDDDPSTFWLALTAALENRWPDRWFDVADLLAEDDPDIDDVAIAMINGLADLDESVVLVIDDFQFAATAAPGLTTLIERLPEACRVIVGSRTEPQLALHRLRIHGQLAEVRDADLRLTRDEVAEVMDAFEIELNETETELVADRTEGWMAGVQMAAMSLRDRPDPDRFLAELAKTPRAITDFLGTEVLDRQTPQLRDFLVATSILDVLDAPSCTAVAESTDAGSMLANLEERNLFLIELDPGIYRYHHLFAGLLRQRLRSEDPDRERALHQRAATYFVDAGDPGQAIDHLLAAGEVAAAFEVFRDSYVDAFYRGDGRLPRQLSSLFEQGAAKMQPEHLADLALALAASGPAGAAEPWIVRADHHLADLDETGRDRLATAHGVVALRFGEPLEIERAFADYQGPEDHSDDERFGYVSSLVARSRLWLGDLAGARRICDEAMRNSDEPSAKHIVMASGLSWVACVEGHLDEAEQLASQALSDAGAIGITGHPILIEALCTRGRVAFERGDLATAERLLEQSVSIGEDVRPAFAATAQLSLARLQLATGRNDEALETVERARAYLPPVSTSPLVAFCTATEGRVAVESGDLDRADACADRLPPDNRGRELRTRIALARGDLDRADAELAGVEPVTLRERLSVDILAARLGHARRSPDLDEALAAVLATARGERFVTVVADELVDLRSRLALLVRSRHVDGYEQDLLDRIEADVPVAVVAVGDAHGPLSDRELTVLRYLASRLTYREIASEIFVSTNTLKTHVQRIYRKLGASTRTEAVAEARRIGVL